MEPNPAHRCIPTSGAVARLWPADSKTHLGRSGAVDSAPEGARRKRGTAHKKQGGLEILRNPRHCGSAEDDDYAQLACKTSDAEGNPAAELGGWKMGCSAPATTSSMCGRWSVHAASNSIRTNLGFMALGRGHCPSLLRFKSLGLSGERSLACIYAFVPGSAALWPIEPSPIEATGALEDNTSWLSGRHLVSQSACHPSPHARDAPELSRHSQRCGQVHMYARMTANAMKYE